MSATRPTLLGLTLAIAASAALAQECQPYWAGLPRRDVPGGITRSIVFDDGSGPTLYVANEEEPIRYFRWRDRQWESLPSDGLPPDRRYSLGMVALDDGEGVALYSIHRFTTRIPRASRWRNGVWNDMPQEFWIWDSGASMYPLASVDLGGSTRIYGRLPAGRIGYWDGQAWQQIGQANDTNIYSMIGYDDGSGMALYVFGDFDLVNGAPAAGMAKWDGTIWSNPWPAGNASYSGQPLLTVWNGYLYSNFMPAIGGVNRRGLHRWDGSTWLFLGGPNTQIPVFFGLHAFDDGSGESLFMTGEFSNFAGLPARNIVRYDGGGFHTVPGYEAFTSLTGRGVIRDERGESLVMSGGYIPVPSAVFPQWVSCHSPTCPADCNADGRLDVRDFVCFINTHPAGDPFGNAQPDGVLNVADFLAFSQRFAAGCP